MIFRLLIGSLFVPFSFLFSQEQTQMQLFEADSSWTRELFLFPIGFAPQLAYEGMEEALFPKNWAKKDSHEFWSYTFAWQIKHRKMLSTGELESSLNMYFDGLMQAVNRDTTVKMPPTQASFTKKKKSRFTGEIVIFDAFSTKKPLTLHVLLDQQLCKKSGKLVLHFRFSPRDFDDPIWQQLETPKLRAGSCD